MLPSTIAEPVVHELEIKRSRFIAQVAPVSSQVEADEFIAEVRKRNWNANHNCVAMVLGVRGDSARSSDDGEPSGTAGVPMLETLRKRELTDIVAVVTRYFGGVLLGAGGLVRAYSGAVSAALDEAKIVHRRMLTEVFIDVPHADAGRIDNWLRDWVTTHDAVLCDTRYDAVAHLGALVPAEQLPTLATDLAALSSGALTPIVGRRQIANVPQ